MAASGALRVTLAPPLPVTWPAPTPPLTVVLTLSVPAPALKVTEIALPPASASETETPVTNTAVSSAVVSGPGTALTGGSLIEDATVTVKLSVSVRAPPEPVKPPSLLSSVIGLSPLKFVSGR